MGKSVAVPQSVYADRAHPFWSAPRDLWLIARTAPLNPYPCMCQGTRPCRRPTPEQAGCPCFGRVDIDVLPKNCCAVREAAFAGGKP